MNKSNNKIIMGILFLILFFVATGYAYIQSSLGFGGNVSFSNELKAKRTATILGKSLEAYIDNVKSPYVSSATGINFAAFSSDTNGKGLYLRSGTESNQYPIYYYRGAVDNNNLIFANFCWKIVRTTDTGGTKILYNGTVNNNQCNNTGTSSQLGSNASFNPAYTDVKYLGYTYGTNNATNSTIKTAIDNWYKTNIDAKNFGSYLEDTVWCNDRTVGSTSGQIIFYGAYDRITGSKMGYPSLDCTQTADKYTLKSGKTNYNSALNGNKLLDYPVAMITVDEMNLAGGKFGSNTSYYLYSGSSYWTLSPYVTDGQVNGGFHIADDGGLNYNVITSSYGVRPAVSLKLGTKISSGDGTSTNPYRVA